MPMSTIANKMARLLEINLASPDAELFPQERGTAEPVLQVPTLDASVQANVTPMLEERFSVCGRWVNATPGHTWLSVEEIAAASGPGPLRSQIEVRAKNWDGSILQKLPWERISVFAIDPVEFDETYLVWPETGEGEPSVVRYIGYSEKRYEHLAAYLSALVDV